MAVARGVTVGQPADCSEGHCWPVGTPGGAGGVVTTSGCHWLVGALSCGLVPARLLARWS